MSFDRIVGRQIQARFVFSFTNKQIFDGSKDKHHTQILRVPIALHIDAYATTATSYPIRRRSLYVQRHLRFEGMGSSGEIYLDVKTIKCFIH